LRDIVDKLSWKHNVTTDAVEEIFDGSPRYRFIESGDVEGEDLIQEDFAMSAVLQLEQAVSQLPPKELARFRKWFEEFDAKVWDRQFENSNRKTRLQGF
jgi:hypothetical protein